MQLSYLIMGLGAFMVLAGVLLLWRGKWGKGANEFQFGKFSVKVQSTSLALIIVGVITFLVPYLRPQQQIPVLEVDALPFKLSEGDATWLVWHAQHLDEVYLTDHRKQRRKVPFSGKEQFVLVEDATFLLEGVRSEGTMSRTATVAVFKSSPAPSIERLAFEPSTITKGDPVVLVWKARNTARALLTHPDGRKQQVANAGFVKLAPQKAESYTLSLENGVTASASVKVMQPAVGQLMGDKPPAIQFFKVTPASIAPQQDAVLSWKVAHADSVEISGIGRVAPEGTRSVRPKQSSTYVLTAENEAARKVELVHVNVAAETTPVIAFTANALTGKPGDTITLAWDVTNATRATLKPDGDDVPLKGSKQVTLPGKSVAFELTAIGADGRSASREVILSVVPQWLDAKSSLLLRQQLENVRRSQ